LRRDLGGIWAYRERPYYPLNGPDHSMGQMIISCAVVTAETCN
jgi:hypothetical protein